MTFFITAPQTFFQKFSIPSYFNPAIADPFSLAVEGKASPHLPTTPFMKWERASTIYVE